MKLLTIICAIWFLSLCPSWASDQEKRFIEFPGRSKTTTFDLDTVKIIQLGRFTIVGTTMEDSDVIKFRLIATDVMRSFCTRPDGKYPAPPDVLTLGSPDMPLRDMEVYSNSKLVKWWYPYARLSMDSEEYPEIISCDRPTERMEIHRYLTNGNQETYLFDCKRGLHGYLSRLSDDPTKAITGFVSKWSLISEYYVSLCRVITHAEPYIPPD
jgi:hypothetical protein